MSFGRLASLLFFVPEKRKAAEKLLFFVLFIPVIFVYLHSNGDEVFGFSSKVILMFNPVIINIR